jgi:hypothetical protein
MSVYDIIVRERKELEEKEAVEKRSREAFEANEKIRLQSAKKSRILFKPF